MHSDIDLRKARRMLWLFGLFKIPMIGFCRPRIETLDEEQICLSIPCHFFTRNHLGSMYFGVLCVGADLAAGFHAFMLARQHQYKVSFAFKSMDAEFIHRAHSRVYFRSDAGHLVNEKLRESAQSQDRVNQNIHISAYNALGPNAMLVARFRLELSLKVKGD